MTCLAGIALLASVGDSFASVVDALSHCILILKETEETRTERGEKEETVLVFVAMQNDVTRLLASFFLFSFFFFFFFIAASRRPNE